MRPNILNIGLFYFWFLGFEFQNLEDNGGVLRPPPRSALCIVQKNEYVIDFVRINVYIRHIEKFGGVLSY